MAKLDRIKEDSAYLRLWLGILVATDIGLIGWLVTQFGRASGWLLASAFLCLIALSGVCFVLHRQIERKSLELEEL